jgi:hypothetical protein
MGGQWAQDGLPCVVVVADRGGQREDAPAVRMEVKQFTWAASER